MTASVPELKRISTQYIEIEDRIRLTGEQVDADQKLTLWLTQRLCNQLVTYLCNWLENNLIDKPLSGLRQGDFQQDAFSNLKKSAAILPDGQKPCVLVHSVDFITRKRGVLLLLKNDEKLPAAKLILEVKQLRQWLGIIYGQFQHAGWPTTNWPMWIKTTPTAMTRANRVLH